VRNRIPQTIVLSFAALIVAGTLLLLLPWCGARGGLTLLQAFFTATSAVCVTGLTVIDPGTDLTPFGQAVLALLIQCGGLGILTLSGFVIATLGRRQQLSDRLYVGTAHGGVRGVSPESVLRHAIVATAVVEAIGAALLFAGFGLKLGSFGLRTAWLAAFHSVSAFCNAGFSLFTKNLDDYRDDPIVSLTIVTLIVVGGIGFVVISDLAPVVRRGEEEWKSATNQVKGSRTSSRASVSRNRDSRAERCIYPSTSSESIT
jgi:trk system potassium uptake protein TrkH